MQQPIKCFIVSTLFLFLMLGAMPNAVHAMTMAHMEAVNTVQGTITAVHAKSFFLKASGVTYAVAVRSTTKYQDGKKHSLKFSSLKVGHVVRVQGVKNSSSKTISAVALIIDTSLPKTTTAALTASVSITNFSFNTSSLTVKKATKVTWTNHDTTSHTVTGDNGGPSSSTLGSGGTYSYSFTATGTFSYHCSIHPGMTGTVIVTE